jgi:hypothetical protein
LITGAEAVDSSRRVVLDMDSTEVPVYRRREQSAYKGHFESTRYHPLLLFNREGDCLAVKLRPGNVQIFPRNTWEHCGPKSAKKLCKGKPFDVSNELELESQKRKSR